MTKAIILLSGGLDSTTTLGVALAKGRQCIPIAFDYVQRHRRELDSAARVYKHYAMKGAAVEMLRLVTIFGFDFKTSALTSDLEVPKNRDVAEKGIPVSYVPARNSVFLSIGTAFAEALGADEVWAGFNAVDYSGYPDCRPEFVKRMQEALALGTARGVEGNPVRLITPIIDDTKVDIIKRALSLDVPLGLTWSCYSGGGAAARPCGECDSCIIRAKAFAQVGVADPAEVNHG